MEGFAKFSNRHSIMHDFHPSLKFVVFIFLIASIFMPTGFFGYIILGSILLVLFFLSKIPGIFLLKSLKSILALFIILLFINWLSMNDTISEISGSSYNSIKDNFGSSELVSLKGKYFLKFNGYHPNGVSTDYKISIWGITDKAIYLSIYVTIKIYFMIIATTILTSTTSPLQLSYGLEKLMTPFKLIKLPTQEAAMMISIALRFIPSLLDESERILKAQASRGVDYHNGKINEKIKATISLIVPLFSISFQKADDLSNAMEARGFNPRFERTRYRTYKIRAIDILIFLSILFLFSGLIVWVVQKWFFIPFGLPEMVVTFA